MFFTFSIGAGGPGTDRRRIRSRFQDEASRGLIPSREKREETEEWGESDDEEP
jgi:hypothetical protein